MGVSCALFNEAATKAAALEAEGESLRWLAANTKPCPKCSFPIEKNGGCLHMRCHKCQHYFCWQVRSKIKPMLHAMRGAS